MPVWAMSSSRSSKIARKSWFITVLLYRKISSAFVSPLCCITTHIDNFTLRLLTYSWNYTNAYFVYLENELWWSNYNLICGGERQSYSVTTITCKEKHWSQRIWICTMVLSLVYYTKSGNVETMWCSDTSHTTMDSALRSASNNNSHPDSLNIAVGEWQ